MLFSGNKDRKPCNLGGLIEATAGLTVGQGPVPAILSPASGPAEHLVPAPVTMVTMNNGKKDTSNADVQKLQEQLNDIKEQVIKFFLHTFSRSQCY